jgi:hypothetical protein
MKTGIAALALALLLTACGSTRTVTVVRRPAPSASGDLRYIGRIVSMERTGDEYLLRFDPTWFLSGITANVAQAEDSGTTCAPQACPPVANDNYRVDEGHRLLTFRMPASTRGTVLVKNAPSGGPFPARTITAPELARVVKGTSDLKLYEPLTTGVWILVHVDTIRTFEQQYVP